jgi:hypothetical protein
MKNIVRIVLILAAIGLVSAALVWKFYVNKPHEDIDSADAAFSLTTEEIWNQYNSSQRTADSLYTGQVIELSGKLSRVDTNDTLVSLIFVMDADSMFGDKTISCQVYQKHNEAAMKLTEGTLVKIKGYCTGYNDPDIKLNKCSIVK